MVEARLDGSLIASSDDTVVVEGKHYFSVEAVNTAVLRPSNTMTMCPWEGTAHYYSLNIDGAEDHDAAWYYPASKSKAENTPGLHHLLEKSGKSADD